MRVEDGRGGRLSCASHAPFEPAAMVYRPASQVLRETPKSEYRQKAVDPTVPSGRKGIVITMRRRRVMAKTKAYRIKEAALIAGVSVRTLHYYDEIKLLTPSDRSAAGYRMYDDSDLLRLQQILIGRSLGLALEDIRRSLDDPAFDLAESLRRQRNQLIERVDETHKMIAAIDRTLDDLADRDRAVDFKLIFDGFDPADHEEEVRTRWGETNAYAQSAKRTKDYTEADWRAMKAEAAEIWSAAAEAMHAAAAPTSETAADIVERHRLHICRWFYDLSPAMHADLADKWAADERFAAHIDKHTDGLTAWMVPAVKAATRLRV
ncbi:MAG: MerR family transcriptional regulator [Roseitalea sp.]|jgi:DNA-binding transcriptional MerR regulator|nr:MerR family transcriptional regulator [Roseitalea sp.]